MKPHTDKQIEAEIKNRNGWRTPTGQFIPCERETPASHLARHGGDVPAYDELSSFSQAAIEILHRHNPVLEKKLMNGRDVIDLTNQEVQAFMTRHGYVRVAAD